MINYALSRESRVGNKNWKYNLDNHGHSSVTLALILHIIFMCIAESLQTCMEDLVKCTEKNVISTGQVLGYFLGEGIGNYLRFVF